MMYKVYSPLFVMLKYYAISRVGYFSVLYIQKLGCSKNYELNSWRYVSKENTEANISRSVKYKLNIWWLSNCNMCRLWDYWWQKLFDCFGEFIGVLSQKTGCQHVNALECLKLWNVFHCLCLPLNVDVRLLPSVFFSLSLQIYILVSPFYEPQLHVVINSDVTS